MLNSYSPARTPPPDRHVDPGWGNLDRAFRLFWPLVLACVVIGVLAGAFAARQQPDQYTTSAKLVLNPLPSNDETFIGLEAIRSGGDVTQTGETAAALLENVDIADATAKRMGGAWTGTAVTDAVTVSPFGQSSVLLVRTQTDSRASAVRLANTYASTAVDVRDRRFQSELRDRIRALEERKGKLRADDYGAQNDAGAKLNVLTSIQAQGGDPTLSLGSPAEPAKVTGTPTSLLAPVGGLAGLVLGSLVALLLVLPHRKLTSADEALALYQLPVLARLPKAPGRLGRGGLQEPSFVGSGAAREAFRSVAARIEHRGTQRIVMVASASRGDGRTIVASGLAHALAELGYSVLLVDCDVNNPQLPLSVGLTRADLPPTDLSRIDRLGEHFAMSPLSSSVAILAAPDVDDPAADDLLRWLPEVLAEGRELADYIIIDTPALGEVVDGVRIAAHADDVVLVARPRNTDKGAFADARDVLEELGVTPVGIVIVGPGRRSGHRGRGRGLDVESRRSTVVAKSSAHTA